jgi:photosystem II stability/assembly factor-like uncharacterized protein
VLAAGDEVLVYGLRGHAYRSRDLGSTWERMDLGSATALTAGTWLNDGSLVLVDETGRILRRDGETGKFAPVALPNPAPLTGVVQARSGVLILSGMRGVMRTALGLTLSSTAADHKP